MMKNLMTSVSSKKVRKQLQLDYLNAYVSGNR